MPEFNRPTHRNNRLDDSIWQTSRHRSIMNIPVMTFALCGFGQ